MTPSFTRRDTPERFVEKVNFTQTLTLIFDWLFSKQQSQLLHRSPYSWEENMRDLTLGKTMEAQRHGKFRDKKGIPPLLVCWLIAVGLMILVSSHGQSATHATPPATTPGMTATPGMLTPH